MSTNLKDLNDIELVEEVVGEVVRKIMVDGKYDLRDVLRRLLSDDFRRTMPDEWSEDAAATTLGFYDRFHHPDSPTSKRAPLNYERTGCGTRDEFTQYWVHVRLDDFRRAQLWTVTGRNAATETEVEAFKCKMDAILTGAN